MMQQLSASQANPEVIINENFDSLSASAIFAKNPATSTGLTWGYYGGLYNSNTISDGTIILTNAADNYVVVLRSSGAVSASTSSANSTNPLYAKLYKVTCAGGVVTAVVDQRWDANGLLFATGSANGGPAVTALSISGGVVNVDCSKGDYFTLALSANVTSFTFSNTPGAGKGFSKWIEITQHASAAKTVALTQFKWAGGIGATAVSSALSAIDVLALTSVDNGTTVRATLSKAFS